MVLDSGLVILLMRNRRWWRVSSYCSPFRTLIEYIFKDSVSWERKTEGNSFLEWQSRLHSEERSEGCHVSRPTPVSALLPFAFLLCTSSLLHLCFLHYVVTILINPCYSSFQTHQSWILHLFHWHHLWIIGFFISLSFLYRSIIETQHQLQREKNLWKADKTGLDIRRRPPQISEFPHSPHPSSAMCWSGWGRNVFLPHSPLTARGRWESWSCPSLTATLRRVGPASHPGNRVELTLFWGVQESSLWEQESWPCLLPHAVAWVRWRGVEERGGQCLGSRLRNLDILFTMKELPP